jgi:demethylspheroidene O-methyltransferase
MATDAHMAPVAASAHRPSLRHDVLRWRDRLVADPRFQRVAASWPVTRWIARRQARRLFDLCAGFVYSQVLAACVELGVFRRLHEQPQTAAELAQSLGNLPVERIERLLRAATALGLTEARDASRYGLGMLGAALVGNPGVEAMIRHHHLLYADLSDPASFFRDPPKQGALARFWGYAANPSSRSLDQSAINPYTELMAASQQFVTDTVLAAYPFRRHRRLLDVGGGDGRFAASVAQRFSGLRVGVFDLPPVAQRARERFAALGLGERATALGGDFCNDALPTGADLVTLVRVVHDHDDDPVRELLRGIRRAIAADGTLLIAEPMAATRIDRVADAYFGTYLLAMGSGRARTLHELSALLRDAGFHAIRHHATRDPLLASVITAKPDPAAARVAVPPQSTASLCHEQLT